MKFTLRLKAVNYYLFALYKEVYENFLFQATKDNKNYIKIVYKSLKRSIIDLFNFIDKIFLFMII